MTTLETAPNPVAQPQRATVRLPITESEAAKLGILDHWEAARKRQAFRAARKARQLEQRNNAARELQQSVLRLFHYAQTEEWGQRKLAAQIGIPQTTLRRIRAMQVDPLVWLPKVRTAAAKLTL